MELNKNSAWIQLKVSKKQLKIRSLIFMVLRGKSDFSDWTIAETEKDPLLNELNDWMADCELINQSYWWQKRSRSKRIYLHTNLFFFGSSSLVFFLLCLFGAEFFRCSERNRSRFPKFGAKFRTVNKCWYFRVEPNAEMIKPATPSTTSRGRQRGRAGGGGGALDGGRRSHCDVNKLRAHCSFLASLFPLLLELIGDTFRVLCFFVNEGLCCRVWVIFNKLTGNNQVTDRQQSGN